MLVKQGIAQASAQICFIKLHGKDVLVALSSKERQQQKL